MSVASPMPKSDQENWRVKISIFFSLECLTFYGVTPFSFMEEGRCPLFMGSRRVPSETEGEVGALFVCYDLLFLLDSQTTRIFCSMMRSTAIRVVTCVTHGWFFVQAERVQSATSLKMVADQERLYPDIISPAWLGKYVWVWLVNEDDWVHRLGLCGFQFWARRLTGELVGGSGPKSMVPTMPPFSWLGRSFFPTRKRE